MRMREREREIHCPAYTRRAVEMLKEPEEAAELRHPGKYTVAR